MTILKLVSIIDVYEMKDGLVPRCRVKEVYGLGFEGAVTHAMIEGFVFIDPTGSGLGLTTHGRRLLETSRRDHSRTT